MPRRMQTGAVGRALALAIRECREPEEKEELLRLCRELEIDRVRRAARRHEIESLVGVGLAKVGMTLPSDWAGDIERNEARVGTLLEATALAFSALSREGIAAAAVEAGGVMLGTSLPIAAYCPSDVDILVAEERWRDVAPILQEAGFHKVGEIAAKRIGYQLGATGRVEVTARPFDRRAIPFPGTDLSQEWLARRIPSPRFPGVSVLEPTDALSLISVHVSLHSFVRPPGLRLHVDADRIVRQGAVEWSRLLKTAREARVARRIFFSLAVAGALLGTPVPEEVLSDLAPGLCTRRALWRVLRAYLAPEWPRFMGAARALLVECLMGDEGIARQCAMLAFPPVPWMREHFGDSSGEAPAWRLHVRRARTLVGRGRV